MEGRIFTGNSLNRLIIYFMIFFHASCDSRPGINLNDYDYVKDSYDYRTDSSWIAPNADTTFKAVLSNFTLVHFPFVFNTQNEYDSITNNSSGSRNHHSYRIDDIHYGPAFHDYLARRWLMDAALHSGRKHTDQNAPIFINSRDNPEHHFLFPILRFKIPQGNLLLGKEDNHSEYSTLWILVYSRDSTLRQVTRLGRYFSIRGTYDREEKHFTAIETTNYYNEDLKVYFKSAKDIGIEVIESDTKVTRIHYDEDEMEQITGKDTSYSQTRIKSRKQWKLHIR